MSDEHGSFSLTRPGQRSVVLAGEFWHGATAAGLARGLRQLDWLVAEVDLDDHVLASRGLRGRLLNRTTSSFFSRLYGDRIVAAVRNTASDLFLTTKGSFVSSRTLRTLGDLGVFRVNYYPDVSFNHPGFSEARFHDYDLIVTTKTYHLEHLRERFGHDRVALVHHGYSPAVHRRREPELNEADYEFDICYIGSASRSKFEWLVGLPRAFPDRRIAIAGAYWEKFVRGTPLERCFVGHRVVGDFYARMLERSKINVALHFGSVSRQQWSDDISTRTFEIPACAGFMLHVDSDEVRSLFSVPDEIDVFSSRDELYDKIAFYLDRPAERRTMIERAYGRCVPAYSLARRGAEIAALLPG